MGTKGVVTSVDFESTNGITVNEEGNLSLVYGEEISASANALFSELMANGQMKHLKLQVNIQFVLPQRILSEMNPIVKNK